MVRRNEIDTQQYFRTMSKTDLKLFRRAGKKTRKNRKTTLDFNINTRGNPLIIIRRITLMVGRILLEHFAFEISNGQ